MHGHPPTRRCRAMVIHHLSLPVLLPSCSSTTTESSRHYHPSSHSCPWLSVLIVLMAGDSFMFTKQPSFLHMGIIAILDSNPWESSSSRSFHFSGHYLQKKSPSSATQTFRCPEQSGSTTLSLGAPCLSSLPCSAGELPSLASSPPCLILCYILTIDPFPPTEASVPSTFYWTTLPISILTESLFSGKHAEDFS